jgi:hypothetical protein
MGVILLIVLVLFLVGGLPRWGYHTYGYGPSGILGVAMTLTRSSLSCLSARCLKLSRSIFRKRLKRLTLQ